MIDDDSAKKWITRELKIKEKDFEKVLIPENSLFFLIVWSLFESKCCDGSARIEKVKKENIKFQKMISIDDYYHHFHDRYQNKELLKNLKLGKKERTIFEELLNIKENDEINKHIFCLIVLIRYRNNLFHGNKNPINWERYETEFRLLISMMMGLIDGKYLIRGT